MLYDWKARNILIYALREDEFYRVSNCKSTQAMWDALKFVHYGTSEVKRYRINTLIHEYELFRLKPKETIVDVQKWFTHIVDHLDCLGKTIPSEDLTNKVLKYLSREWKTKFTAISESRNLAKMQIPSYATSVTKLDT